MCVCARVCVRVRVRVGGRYIVRVGSRDLGGREAPRTAVSRLYTQEELMLQFESEDTTRPMCQPWAVAHSLFCRP